MSTLSLLLVLWWRHRILQQPVVCISSSFWQHFWAASRPFSQLLLIYSVCYHLLSSLLSFTNFMTTFRLGHSSCHWCQFLLPYPHVPIVAPAVFSHISIVAAAPRALNKNRPTRPNINTPNQSTYELHHTASYRYRICCSHGP